MTNNSFSWELFEQVPIVGILRNIAFDDFKEVFEVCKKVGLTNLEITMNTPRVEEMISYAFENSEGLMNVGAGTVCSESDLERALEAGSQFIVTPILSKAVIEKCVELGVAVFPGAYTPTEIYNAWTWGAKVVKVFPATALGPSFIKDLKGPLDQIKLLPTGGVSLDNIQAFKAAGAAGYGIGSQLFNKKLIAENNWKELQNHIEQYILKTQD
ncbi:bifunctional 4-hydroxy-2-oxoglutarate aldolase/2-dehydro-3-deoxy-phosphogluconate aldolase [Arcticibacterium luteifluviistationis]|uniref:2-dehydro-3-deoxyphosphogluconate aldolase n=1 Tax=Arcticibacterium luteifluviistationis TaxID=1784714 RepID=A0A2Z4GDT6_9BACT|nr:bifunctional 4-hydroxy-2-oxoglutarate aldolase/2-dehydro-3-deoxy-phosphogluconate aldolase [Arcticibacterium luteifluviistationis]AWV99300.1 2-dehydro-3-deoxyphosphogluconate aldolase [Arcticibacterium luteifluviistationis]